MTTLLKASLQVSNIPYSVWPKRSIDFMQLSSAFMMISGLGVAALYFAVLLPISAHLHAQSALVYDVCMQAK